MAKERRIAISRVAVRLMCAAGAAALMAGCADSSRFADPFTDVGELKHIAHGPLLEPMSQNSASFRIS